MAHLPISREPIFIMNVRAPAEVFVVPSNFRALGFTLVYFLPLTVFAAVATWLTGIPVLAICTQVIVMSMMHVPWPELTDPGVHPDATTWLKVSGEGSQAWKGMESSSVDGYA